MFNESTGTNVNHWLWPSPATIWRGSLGGTSVGSQDLQKDFPLKIHILCSKPSIERAISVLYHFFPPWSCRPWYIVFRAVHFPVTLWARNAAPRNEKQGSILSYCWILRPQKSEGCQWERVKMMGENEDSRRTTLREMMMKCVFVIGLLVGMETLQRFVCSSISLLLLTAP